MRIFTDKCILISSLILYLVHCQSAYFEPKSSLCTNPDLIDHCCSCNLLNANGNQSSGGVTKIPTTPRYDVTPYNYPPLPQSYENFGSVARMRGKLVVADNNPDYLPDQTLEGYTLVHVMEYSETLGSWLHTVITTAGDSLSGQGHTLSVSENFIFVGNPSRDPANVGLFVRTFSPPWSLSLVLNEPTPRSEFGYSLVVEESSQRLFVSDPAYMNDLGRVYVYFTYSDIIIDTLNHPYAITSEGSRFGHCISVSGDLAIVSSPQDDINGYQEIGSVHLFQQELGGTKWRFLKSFHPTSPTTEGRHLVSGRKFGWSIAYSGGSFFVVGSYSSDCVEIYKQRITGDRTSFYHFQTITSPYVPTLISRFGFSVDILGDRLVVGDPNYIVSPSAQGKVFIYEYSHSMDTWLNCQTLVDDQKSFHTHFGQSVSLGSPRFLCIGAPDTDSVSNGNGKVWVLDLDRSQQCSGCDGVVNSGNVIDQCGICAGDNSSCSGCDNVPNSGLVFDYCGVCGGDNSTCLFSQSLVNIDNPCSFSGSSSSVQQSSPQVQLLHFEHEPAGNKVIWSVLSPPSGTAGLRIFSLNAGDFGYVPSVFSSLPSYRVPDSLGNYPVDEFELQVRDTYSHVARVRVLIHFPPCIGCDGIPDSGTILDSCGICGGNNSTCADCLGVPYGNNVLDYCMTCTDTLQANKTCLHVLMNMPPPPLQQKQQQQGNIFMSSSDGGLVYQIPCGGGFSYNWQTCEPYRVRTHIKWSLVNQPAMGHATIGFHSGNLSYAHDKETHLEDGQEILYIKATDGYGNVGIGKITAQIIGCTIRGCDGQMGSGIVVDRCGICGGNDSCVDCSGTPYGGMKVDACGICGGNSDTCVAGIQGAALVGDPITIPIAVIITFVAVCVIGGCVVLLYFLYFCIRSAQIRGKIRRSHSSGKKVRALMAQPAIAAIPQTTTTKITTTTTTTGFQPSPFGQQQQPLVFDMQQQQQAINRRALNTELV